MLNPETDLLFPPFAIQPLSGERGTAWQNLVTEIASADTESLQRTAFILMMARMNSCITCNSDSFRAMNGCVTCSKQSLKRFRGTDADLVQNYESAKIEVKHFLTNRPEGKHA